jgi:hypothetical protein
MEGASIEAARKGFESIGVKDNEVLIFSKLMDAKSLFLTANADTVYVLGVLDLTKGPMVLEVPPRLLGTIGDHWFRWVIDIGLPGAGRAQGGKYLIVPPGLDLDRPRGRTEPCRHPRWQQRPCPPSVSNRHLAALSVRQSVARPFLSECRVRLAVR